MSRSSWNQTQKTSNTSESFGFLDKQEEQVWTDLLEPRNVQDISEASPVYV